MKEKRIFEADDGTIFSSMKEVLDYEKILTIKDWYENNKIYGSFEGCKIEWEDLLDWLDENKDKVLALLKIL